MGGGVDDRYGVRGEVFDAINKAEYLGSPALVANTPGDCAVDDGARSWLKDQVAGDCAMQDQLDAAAQRRTADHHAVQSSILLDREWAFYLVVNRLHSSEEHTSELQS